MGSGSIVARHHEMDVPGCRTTSPAGCNSEDVLRPAFITAHERTDMGPSEPLPATGYVRRERMPSSTSRPSTVSQKPGIAI